MSDLSAIPPVRPVERVEPLPESEPPVEKVEEIEEEIPPPEELYSYHPGDPAVGKYIDILA